MRLNESIGKKKLKMFAWLVLLRDSDSNIELINAGCERFEVWSLPSLELASHLSICNDIV